MKINGISYWVKDGKCEMLNLDNGLKILRIPAFMDKVNGEVIGLCGSVKKIIVEDGNLNYYVNNNCLMFKDGELIAGAVDGVIPTDGSVKRIGNMAFLGKAPMHLVIPDGVKSIGYRAFAESENLRSVYIPESVEEISSAFERCDNLKNIFFGGNREQWNALVQNQEEKLFCREPHYVYCKYIEGRHLCPICGKTMFPGDFSCDICDICGWEDDVNYERFPHMESCANGYTVTEYQKMYFERVKADPDYNWWADVNKKEVKKMTAFEKWNGFIEQLIYFECPADNEKSRLRAELALIEKTNSAEVFQAIYDAWLLLIINGIRSYITGEAEEWFIFYFLDMVRENPIEREVPTQIPSKITFVMEEKAKK